MMDSFDRAWDLVKERCEHTKRIITTDGSYMARCIREKGHPPSEEGVTNNFQMIMGGHVYPTMPEDGLMLSNEDIIPRHPLNESPLPELEGYE